MSARPLVSKIFILLTSLSIVGCSSQSNSLYDQKSANAIKAKHWLSLNAKREGVMQTESGLQYIILKKTDGCYPDDGYKVKVHYKMVSVQSKSVVDSSYDRGQPSEFKLSKTIKGWREGVPMMRVGEIWELYIPSDLGYGPKGLGRDVPPNSVLVSQVHLVSARRCES
jgi:FKBP-type peptidyl-prolyl cis-trans isomerase FkpA/FKBP-type peptidyl-prolyl cis-trans isomerase FklB